MLDKMNIDIEIERLSKRLAYILRYGAINIGLTVHKGGYVEFDELIKLPMLKYNSSDQIKHVINSSMSLTGVHRFQLKNEAGSKLMVRSIDHRIMDPAENHIGTNVSRLVNSCLDVICQNIKLFDLREFPDEYLLGHMFQKLKRSNRLTNATFKSLISSSVSGYNFNGVYITEGTLKLLAQRCKKLNHLNLKSCGYVVTDHIVHMLAKNLTMLDELNVSNCCSLTDNCLNYLLKYKVPIRSLGINYCPLITKTGISEFVCKCDSLEDLYMVGFTWMDDVALKEMKSFRTSPLPLNIYYVNALSDNNDKAKVETNNGTAID